MEPAQVLPVLCQLACACCRGDDLRGAVQRPSGICAGNPQAEGTQDYLFARHGDDADSADDKHRCAVCEYQ
ncbi:hypothetical protein SDC9_202481 [bioreactor metagenome]|uniref:Uncharacterized protein n=1 Tax=bioreactor metagenome TaxID=1076179 RepID=A0A645J2V3_9ZZZZ